MTRKAPRMLLPCVAIATAAVGGTPAFAERIETYWRLEPVSPEAPTTITFGQPFFEQRLLPVKMVELTEPLAVGNQTFPAGTLLYLVFNLDRKIAYCTIKDRSLGHQARTLFIPILDQRPCFVDSDGDGRFDKAFFVFDKYGGPPSARGSINSAQPLPSTAAYRDTDIHKFPNDLRLSFIFSGKHEPAKAQLNLEFSRYLGARWPAVKGQASADGATFQVVNAEVQLGSVTGNAANVNVRWANDIYVSTNNRNTLYWGRLPDFVPHG